ncbi:MAG: DapH/DapD/GlmU-related protein [Paracoccaceae bacterium]
MALVATVRNFLYKNVVVEVAYLYYTKVLGMNFGERVRISRGARLDKTNPRGVHIDDYTIITSGAIILSHDFVHREWKNTYVGKNCFVGYNAIVMPGITIGGGCIIGANSVVSKDIPAHSVAVGIPARVVESDIVTGSWGVRLDRGKDAPA